MPSCGICGKKAYSDRCVAHKVRKPIATKAAIRRPTKRIKQRGKQSVVWDMTRAAWLALHPGRSVCHYCRRGLGQAEITLDHKIPRSRAPHLRNDPGNIVPACYICNGKKGSIAHDDYPHNCPDEAIV